MLASPFRPRSPRRPEDHHEKKKNEEEHLAIGRCHVIAAQRLNDTDADASQQRTFDAPHAAEDHDDESDEHEVQPYRREYGKKRNHHAGSEPDEPRTGCKSDEKNPRDRYAHQHRGLAVLHDCPHGFAEVGRLQDGPQHCRAGDRHCEAEEKLRLGIEWPDGKGASPEDRRNIKQIGREQHQCHVLHQDRERHGGEDDHQVWFVETRADNQPINESTEQKHAGNDCDDGSERIEPKEFGHRPCAVHADHQELAVGEVHDAKHSEYQGEAEAHECIDTADESSGDNELHDRVHRLPTRNAHAR